jgi:hypothetical protein
MSLGKNKQDSQQSFDPELKGMLTDTFRQGQRVAATPYTPYNYATIAPLAPAQLEGMNMAADTARAGVGQGEINDAIATTRAETGFQPSQVTAGSITAPGQVGNVGASNVQSGFGFAPINNQQVQAQGVSAQQIGGLNPLQAQQVQGQTVGAESLAQTDLTPYQNQYDSGVIDAALGDLDRARQMTQNQNAASAVSAGAFGGDRQALVEAETNRNFARQAADTAVNLRQQGFQNAQQQAQADLNRAQQAGMQTASFGQQAALANQQAGLTAGGQNLQADLARQQANQRAGLAADTTSAANFMRAGQLNAANNLAAQRATQQGDIQAAQLGQRGQLANQDAQMRAALANQNAAIRNQQLGFDAQRFNADAGLQAALANQRAGMQASGMRQGAAAQLANLGGDLRGTQFADAAALQGVGGQQQAAAQQLLDDRYRRFAEAREYPFRMFDVLRSGAGLLPNPLTSSSKGRSTNIGLPGS